jgi:hypothetical protein
MHDGQGAHIADNQPAAQEEIVGNPPAWNGHEPFETGDAPCIIGGISSSRS